MFIDSFTLTGVATVPSFSLLCVSQYLSTLPRVLLVTSVWVISFFLNMLL